MKSAVKVNTTEDQTNIVGPDNQTSQLNSNSLESLLRSHNTAMVSTRSFDKQSLSHELSEALSTPEVHFILDAIRKLSIAQKIPQDEAAESIITTFRKIDRIWKNFIFIEGLEKIQKSE